jgi:hypothetical protein
MYIDLVNPTPSSTAESACVSELDARISGAGDILMRYNSYQDCQQLISIAISDPNPSHVDAAWAGATPNVRFQADLFDYACKIVSGFQELVTFFTSQPGRIADLLQEHPAATKRFADLFGIIIQFDDITMKMPRLLGDLSFFRRTASRRPDFGDYDDLYQKSSEMSMFFAIPSPLLTKIVTAVRGSAKSPAELTRLLELLAGIVDMFTSMQTNHPSDDQELNCLCYKTIIGGILLYDSISSEGAFHPKAGIHCVPAVEVVVAASPRQSMLLNLIKYGSKHFKEPTTNKRIAEMIN